MELSSEKKEALFADLDNEVFSEFGYDVDSVYSMEDEESIEYFKEWLGVTEDTPVFEIINRLIRALVVEGFDPANARPEWVLYKCPRFFGLDEKTRHASPSVCKALVQFSPTTMSDVVEKMWEIVMSVLPDYIAKRGAEFINQSSFLQEYFDMIRTQQREKQDAIDHEKGFRSDTDEEKAFDYGF